MAIPTNIKNILNNDIVESARVEFKEGFNPSSVIHTICAFINDIDNFYGGYIIIGINNEGKVIGFDKNKFDDLEKDLLNYCKKCFETPYVPIIDLVKYKDKDIVVIWCPTGSDRPYRCYEDVYKKKGETRYLTYIRKGSSTIVASKQDENELLNLSKIEPFDDRINYHYSLNVLDRNLIEQYLKLSNSNLLNNFYNNDLYETLFDLNLIGGPKENVHPKNVALLMFTKNPHKYIPYSYIDLTIFNDNSGTNFIEKKFDSSLYNQYIECMDYIKNNVISKKTIKIKNDYKSRVLYNYSFEVLEEVIANALLHKSYQINEPVSIRIEPDKIEVTSIPGFDRTISDIAIKELKPKSKRYQYRRIAEFLKDLKIVEAKNTGYPIIINKTLENHSPLPIIEMNSERDYVTVIIPINEAFKSINSKSLKTRIFNALNECPMTKTQLCRYLGYNRVVNSVSYQLNLLIKENKVILVDKKYYLK